MRPGPPTPRPERRQTDQSLQAERAALEESGEAVIQRARDKADGVVRTARKKADARMDSDGATPADRRGSTFIFTLPVA